MIQWFTKFLNWLDGLFSLDISYGDPMFAYTLTKPDGTVYTFVSDVELPLGDAVIGDTHSGEVVQGGGGPGSVRPPV